MRIPRLTALVCLLAGTALAEEPSQSVEPAALFAEARERLAAGDNQAALELFERVAALAPDDDVVLSGLAQALVNLGQVDEAREVYRRAARLAAGHGARDRLAIHHQSLVVLASLYPPALQRAREAASSLPATPAAQQALAEFGPLAQQIANLMAMGRLDEARPLAERALAVARKGFGEDHQSTLWALNSLADVRRVQHDAKGALPLYAAAARSCARRFGDPDFPDCLTYRNNQAASMLALGRIGPAVRIMEAVCRAGREALGADHLLTLIYEGELGLLLSKAGQPFRGLSLLGKAIEACGGLLDMGNPHCLALQGKLVGVAQEAGLHGLARDHADRALEAGRASLPDGHPLRRDLAQTRASLRACSDDLGRAVEKLEAELSQARRRRADISSQLEWVWTLAGAYESQGQVQKALPLRREVLAGRRGALGPEHELVLVAESELAALLLELGLPFEAVPLFEHVRAGLGQQKGEAHADTLTAAGGLGHALFQAGQLGRARSVLEAGLALARERLGASHETSLGLANNLGLVMSGLGQGERARALYQESWETLQAAGQGEGLDGLRARHNLAQALRSLGLTSEAEAHERASLDGRTLLLGRDHPTTLYSLHGLGVILSERGHLAEARLTLEEALKLRREVLGARHPEVLTTLAALAQLQAALGETEEARASLEETARVAGEVLGADHPRSLELEAGALSERLRTDPAGGLGQLEELAGRCRRLLGEAHELTCNLDFSAAHLRFRLERGEPAWSRLRAVLEDVRRRLGPGHPLELQATFLAAREALHLGLPALAREGAQRAWRHWQATEGPGAESTIDALTVLSSASAMLGEEQEALRLARLGVRGRLERAEARLWAADDETRALLAAEAGGHAEGLVGFLLEIGGAEVGRLALEVAFASKGLALRAAAEVAALTRAQADPALAGQARELADLRRELGERLAGGPRGEPPEDHAARLEALRDKVRAGEIRLARSVAGLQQAGERPAFDAVAARVGKDEALVEFLVYRALDREREGAPRLAAAILAPGASPETGLVDLGPLAEISERTQVLRGLLGLPDLSAPEAHLDAQARRLHALLWQPLAPWLRGRARVWVVPEGPLNLLPFAVLRGPDGRFLVQAVELGLLGSSRELLPRPTSAPARTAGEALVLAGPDFGPAGPVAPGDGGLAGLRFQSLAGAAGEGEQVARLLEAHGRKVHLLGGAAASEGALRRAHRPELLHLATHGFYLDASRPPAAAGDARVAGLRGLSLAGRPPVPAAPPGGPRGDPLVRSGLALAAANGGVQGQRQADGNDGLLLALEALDLDLQGCRLVVLSACETGLGDVRQGEGVQGLRRAFLEAGAQAVLVTLWQVSDEGTRGFMRRYYGHLLAGAPAPRALTLTQRELLGDADLAHPFFWAPFLVVGAGR